MSYPNRDTCQVAHVFPKKEFRFNSNHSAWMCSDTSIPSFIALLLYSEQEMDK